jgi:pyruvate kinase
VRATANRLGRHVAVLADLPGPKMRAGAFPDGGAEFTVGSMVSLVSGEAPSSDHVLHVDYPALVGELAVGDRVVVGDGAIAMRVVSKTDTAVFAEVESGAHTQGRPGVHLGAGDRLSLRAPTVDDLALAETMAAGGVDYLALSFARTAADIEQLRAVAGDRARIIAKVETAAALGQLAEIAESADAVMVARGDLGIDCPLEDVPHLQKQIIRRCVEVGTPVVTATQMLESMIDSPSPTRAEVSDVANAVFDGTDAVMLSAETAVGRDPALVVRTMARIAERAEREADYRQWGARLGRIRRREADDVDRAVSDRITDSITHAAWQAADDVGAAAIICCTRTGRLGRSMARFRPSTRLVGMSPNTRSLQSLALSWGVEPVLIDEVDTTDDMVWLAVEKVVDHGMARRGDTVVVIAGAPDRLSGAAADVMRIVRVR